MRRGRRSSSLVARGRAGELAQLQGQEGKESRRQRRRRRGRRSSSPAVHGRAGSAARGSGLWPLRHGRLCFPSSLRTNRLPAHLPSSLACAALRHLLSGGGSGGTSFLAQLSALAYKTTPPLGGIILGPKNRLVRQQIQYFACLCFLRGNNDYIQ